MAKGDIVIPISSETKAFRQGVESGIIKPLDDAEKALEDLGRSRGPDQLEDGMRDAQRATEKLGDETKRTADAIERDFRDSYRKVAASSDDSFSKMREHGEEAGTELRQNFGETVATFRGDLEDIPQLAQDTFGGLAAGLGPAGAIGAGLVAALIGLGTQLVTNWQADQEKMSQAASEWADKYIEAGTRVLTFEQVASSIRDVLTDPTKLKEAQAAAKAWGVDTIVAIEAQAGMPTAIGAVKTAVGDLKTAYEEAGGQGALLGDVQGNLNAQAVDAVNKYSDAKKRLDELTGAMDMGALSADIYSDFLKDMATTTEGATRKVDKFGDTIVTLPDGHQIYIDAETGQATDDVDKIKNQVYGLKDKTVKVTAKVNVDDTALRRYRAAPISVPALVNSPVRNWVID